MRAALLCVLLAACGPDDADDLDIDCTMVTNDDTFVVGLEKMGQNQALDFKLLEATPAPPARFDNTWVVQINAGSDGLANADLQVTPFMLKHEHVSAIHVVSTPMTEAGVYKLEHVNFSMPGVWQTTIRATAGAQTDSGVYTFCIE